MLQAQGFTCFEAGSGREALTLLDRIGEAPLVISDMRMPELDGIGLLEVVRQRYPDTSVIMLTGMSETTTAVDCLHMGAADFLLKPISVSELRARVSRVLEKRALVLENRFHQENLERQVRAQALRIQELFLQGVQMLARALEAKDAYTRGHSIRVSQYAVGTAERLGFEGQSLDGIRLGGELHDIGKIGTREAVLHKPGLLTADEFRQITEHPVLGERMLLPLAQESPDVLRIVRSHHERLDGRGFPDGLCGETDSDRGAHRRGGRRLRRDDDGAPLSGFASTRRRRRRAPARGGHPARPGCRRGVRDRLPRPRRLAAVGLVRLGALPPVALSLLACARRFPPERQASFAAHLFPRGGRQLRVVSLEGVELGLGEVLEVRHGGLRPLQGAQQLVQLDLHGHAVAVLGVLDQENHQKRDDGRPRVDHELPGVAELEDGAGDGPEQDDQHGQAERDGMTRRPGGRLGEPCEMLSDGHR